MVLRRSSLLVCAALLMTVQVVRAQPVASSKKCPRNTWAQRATKVSQVCCVGGSQPTKAGHRRALQKCTLPSKCPSQACAMQFLEFMNECPALVATDPARKPKYNVLLASCKLMASATGPGDGKSGSAILCPTNHVLCTSQAPDPRGGLMPANCHTECRKKALPSIQSCRSPSTGAWTDSTIAEFMSVVQGSPKVLIFGIPREPSGNAALKRFYDESVCFHGRKLSPDMESFLNCRFPDDTFLGNNFPLHSWIFIGGRFFGNGYTLAHTPSNELERRLKAVNADRTCGVAGRPPPPPPGGACLHPGSTHIVAADTTVPAQCQALKALLPTKPGGLGLKCNAFADSGPWNNFLECAFRAHNWVRFRHGGQGGCGGPTLFAFCEKTFAGDPDAIQCCSNTRCAWSASLFGPGGGSPYCINSKYAVNVCCSPCPCWLSPRGVTPGGRGNMTIIENYHGRSYPVLVNSDGLAVAAPFKCGQTGLFANRAVTPLSVWQPRMGDCSHDPMGGRRALMGLTVDDGAH